MFSVSVTEGGAICEIFVNSLIDLDHKEFLGSGTNFVKSSRLGFRDDFLKRLETARDVSLGSQEVPVKIWRCSHPIQIVIHLVQMGTPT